MENDRGADEVRADAIRPLPKPCVPGSKGVVGRAGRPYYHVSFGDSANDPTEGGRVRHGIGLSRGSCGGTCLSDQQYQPPEVTGSRWSKERAEEWWADLPWLAGCNFVPSTASNQLEMWQADTFDLETIDRELGWAADLGFKSMRVFLHDLLWADGEAFLGRVEQFLEVADGHGIGAVLVLFDGVWDPKPKPGKQREPRPHVHNSRWVQSPGAEILGDPGRHDELEPYVSGVIERFRSDARIHAWDLFNEPDNPNPAYTGQELEDKAEMALALLKKAFDWAREAEPEQPLTAGVWRGHWRDADRLRPIERLSLERSDVISFHNYGPLESMARCVENLRRYERPLMCTEYMSRGQGSTFDPILGYLREQKVGAYSWGLVAGRSQTQYPWDSWVKQYEAEPEMWFHDILHADGEPHSPAEAGYIKRTASVAD